MRLTQPGDAGRLRGENEEGSRQPGGSRVGEHRRQLVGARARASCLGLARPPAGCTAAGVTLVRSSGLARVALGPGLPRHLHHVERVKVDIEEMPAMNLLLTTGHIGTRPFRGGE